VDSRHIKGHYRTRHPTIKPTRIVPGGPAQDLFRLCVCAVSGALVAFRKEMDAIGFALLRSTLVI